MSQNRVKIICNQQNLMMDKPKSIQELKEKVSNNFNINRNNLNNMKIKIKSPLELEIENEQTYIDMIFCSNLENIIIEIEVPNNNIININELNNQMENLYFNNNNNRNNNHNNNNFNNIRFNNYIPEPSNYQNYYPEANEINEDYSCYFYENNYTLELSLSQLKKEQNRIRYVFKIQNNGQKPWPDDTILKCVNDDSEIFFYHCKIGQTVWVDNLVYNEFEVILNFKNDFPNKGIYSCRAFLVSDELGKMGKQIGKVNVKIY